MPADTLYMTVRLASGIGIAMLVAAASLVAQDAVQTFRSSVDVVPVRASVRDGDGRPIRGLVQRDFTVLDNGEQRPIRMFHADVAAPITAAFLVDVSGSMAVSNRMALAHDVVLHATQAMRPGEDEAALFTFDTRVDARRPFGRDFGDLASILLKIEPFGATSLYDMVADTAKRIQATPSAHAALVVVTDGFDTSSALTPVEVSAIASAAQVPIYVVATAAASDKAAVRDDDGPAKPYGVDLRDLAAWSGGGVFVASSPLDAQAAAAALVRDLRHQYVLSIDAAATGDWRRLEVQVRKKGAVVRARSGYFGKARRS
jgi:Ca-activated chloride channel family protein